MKLIKKVKTLLKLLDKLEVSFNESTNSYIIESDSNIIIKSKQNIITISEGDNVIISRFLHLNPKIIDKDKTERYVKNEKEMFEIINN